ncbi:MAG: glycosyltransferase [Planctomycetota bacterium]
MSAPAIRPLRIVVVASRYLEDVGGAETVARVGVEGLRARGHRVDVVSLAAPGERSGFTDGRRSDASVHRLQPDNLYHPHDAARWPWLLRAAWHLRDLSSPRNARHVDAILREADADLMVSHNLKGLGLRVAEAPRRAGVPHVHVLHDLQLCVASGVLVHGRERRGDATPALRGFHARRARARLASPDLVLSPSRYLLSEHRAAGFFPHSRTEVLPLPRPAAAAGNVPPGPARVAFAGQLVAHKGVQVLLAAWRLRNANAELHIAGDGALREDVQAAAAADASITVHGRLRQTDLCALYARTDVVVVPSLCHEGANLVACEAQAHGAFVVASAVGGLPEYVSPDGGALVAPDDPPALAAAIAAACARVDRLRTQRGRIASQAPGLEAATYIDRFASLLEGLASVPHP